MGRTRRQPEKHPSRRPISREKKRALNDAVLRLLGEVRLGVAHADVAERNRGHATDMADTLDRNRREARAAFVRLRAIGGDWCASPSLYLGRGVFTKDGYSKKPARRPQRPSAHGGLGEFFEHLTAAQENLERWFRWYDMRPPKKAPHRPAHGPYWADFHALARTLGVTLMDVADAIVLQAGVLTAAERTVLDLTNGDEPLEERLVERMKAAVKRQRTRTEAT